MWAVAATLQDVYNEKKAVKTQTSLDKYFKRRWRDEPQSSTSDEPQPSTSEPVEPEPKPSTSGLQADDEEVLYFLPYPLKPASPLSAPSRLIIKVTKHTFCFYLSVICY